MAQTCPGACTHEPAWGDRSLRFLASDFWRRLHRAQPFSKLRRERIRGDRFEVFRDLFDPGLVVRARGLRLSRAAKVSMSGMRPEARSFSDRRALAIAASSLDRVSSLMARGSSRWPCAGSGIYSLARRRTLRSRCIGARQGIGGPLEALLGDRRPVAARPHGGRRSRRRGIEWLENAPSASSWRRQRIEARLIRRWSRLDRRA